MLPISKGISFCHVTMGEFYGEEIIKKNSWPAGKGVQVGTKAMKLSAAKNYCWLHFWIAENKVFLTTSARLADSSSLFWCTVWLKILLFTLLKYCVCNDLCVKILRKFCCSKTEIETTTWCQTLMLVFSKLIKCDLSPFFHWPLQLFAKSKTSPSFPLYGIQSCTHVHVV